MVEASTPAGVDKTVTADLCSCCQLHARWRVIVIMMSSH